MRSFKMLLLTLALPLVVGAQQGAMTTRAVLALPADPARNIAAGETKRSALQASDGMLSDSAHFARWYFSGKRGERVTVTLSSEAFDTFLLIGQLSAESPAAENDDSDGTNSAADLTLPADGMYVIIASSFAPRETGDYTLMLEVKPPAAGMSGPVTPTTVLLREAEPMQRLGLNQRMGSQLDSADTQMDDSTHFELWYFSANAGDQITVTLESSEISAALFVGAQGSQQVEAGSVGQRPTVRFTAQAAGTYVVVVKGNTATERGSYMLDLRKGPAQP